MAQQSVKSKETVQELIQSTEMRNSMILTQLILTSMAKRKIQAREFNAKLSLKVSSRNKQYNKEESFSEAPKRQEKSAYLLQNAIRQVNN
ncbi:hypothetical protein L484_010528 [Morus notabilis]|uniref:Uncharacterized protein n=1 Tax=Morus notabilis TaxID=981085 RepID=W9RHD3_9ROSA|nr:hypothetical protein L484_010528 [Morus notabilis]